MEPDWMLSPLSSLKQQWLNVPRERQAVVFLRVATGAFLLWRGYQVYVDPGFVDAMSATVRGWLVNHPIPIYRDFLQGVVLHNASFFAHGVAYGEMAIGASFVLGALMPYSVLAALLMNVSFILASQHADSTSLGLNAAFMLIALTLLFGNAGKHYGLDYWLLKPKKSTLYQRPTQVKPPKKLQVATEMLEKNRKPKPKSKTKPF